MTERTDPRLAALGGSMRDFKYLPGTNLLDRVGAFYEWQQARRQSGLWPLGRSTDTGPRSKCIARSDEGAAFEGINFASQDYLSLSSHPAIRQAAVDAIEEFGVHSAGSPALVGNTSLSLLLERKISEFLELEHVTLFPTGWGAGFGVVKGLVRPSDHIVMDALSHACLQEGAQAATSNIHYYRHNSIPGVRQKLEKIRAKDGQNGILIITESLFSMDSDTPDIAGLQALAREYDAILCVDVAHDLGCLGPEGRGHIGAQDMLGKVDVVMGSFSKTFASNGGFVACNQRSVKEYLRYYSSPCTFSNALSPSQAAIVLNAFDIVESDEGEQLRSSLMTNIRLLRELLHGTGFETYGDPSPIVCVKMGSEGLARLVSRRLPEAGLLANLVEFPAVPKGQARFRMQVMAKHTNREIIDAVHRLSVAHAQAGEQHAALLDGSAELSTMDALLAERAATPAAAVVAIRAPAAPAFPAGEKSEPRRQANA
jgi:glycine C-acetyltransferase